MSTPHTEMKPPLLLLAMPQVADPFFNRSVVLLVQHDAQGSLGFILNRPTGSRVAEVLKEMGMAWGGQKELPVHFGGPVHPHLGTLLFDDTGAKEGAPEGGGLEIAGVPGVRFTRDLNDLEKLAGQPPPSFRLLLGYAGWGPGQLMEEILRNDWLVAPPRKEFLFPADPAGVWAEALKSVGVDPEALLTWAPGTDQGPVA